MKRHAVPPSTGLSLTPAMPSFSISYGSVWRSRNSVEVIPSRAFSRTMSTGVSEMSMLLQHAFQHAMPRWQRNRMAFEPSSAAGSTGLSGKGLVSIIARPRLLPRSVGCRLEQLRLVDQVDVLALEAGPLPRLAIVDRVDEAVPVLLVDEVLVGAVVEARVARFLAELDVLHVRFGGDDAGVVLPGAQQLVQVLGAHLGRVFLQQRELFFGHREQLVVGVVVGGDAGDVLVHDLLQPELQHLGRDVVRVDVLGGGVVLVLHVGANRRE